MSKKKNQNEENQDDFLGELQPIENETAETPTRENPPMKKDLALTAAAADSNPFESEENFMPLEGIPFAFGKQTEPGTKFEGAYIGIGAKLETAASRGEAFDTIVFLDVTDQSYKRLPMYEVLKKIPEKFNPGEAVIRITYKGVKKSAKGSEYNDYQVEAKRLITPLVAGKHWDDEFISK